MSAKAIKSYKKGGKVKKMTPKTTDTARGGSTDGMARGNFMKARERSAEHMRGTAHMAGMDDKPAKSLEKRKYKKGGKVVAQGADKADLRAERKHDRIQRKNKRK